ncbi:GAF domain-containing sensor histidine kinase [Desulfitibacter alkalitolerans]|uniref:GAF domain-containing sensor histidine kinase n=1 Tax=Desulfitibacter alkalitolerans TaxID=264641 RepID=UPI0004823DB5|nr:ATP-binding protein [Desulfitibacter alkalitolerans]
MHKEKLNLIEDLTGIRSSKKNYYIELKKKNFQTQRQNAQLEIINELTKSINVNMSLQEMMENVAHKLNYVFTFDILELSLINNNKLEVKVSLPAKAFDEVFSWEGIEKGQSLYWDALKNNRSFLLQDISREYARYYEEKAYFHMGIKSLIVVPLAIKEKVIGNLALLSKKANGFDESDLTFSKQLADQLAVCLENTRLYEKVKEKLAIESQLRQSTKLAAVGQMAAGIAHELNNPLTAILGNAQLLQRNSIAGSKESKIIEDIVKCGVRCKRIIQSLLTFARQDYQPFTNINLNNAVKQSVELFSYQIGNSNVKLELDLDSGVLLIKGNIQQLEQVIVNFILNGKDAVADVDNPTIWIETGICYHQKLGSCTYASVKDNGHGIEKNQLTEIFNPFYTTKPPGQGTGLGLSVSLGIAEAHGGSIEVTSKPGIGSTFTLYIPLVKGDG